MNTATVVATIALVVIVYLAVSYIVKEKKKGNKCIGCPYADSCTRMHSEHHMEHGGKCGN